MEISPLTAKASLDVEMFNQKSEAKGKSSLNQEDFFKLLTAQLAAQDPLKPMDDMSFISQMASFSSLQQMQGLSESFTKFSQQQGLASAGSYLEKNITVKNEAGEEVRGKVTALQMDAGQPKVVVNGAAYPLSSITGILMQSPQ